MAGMILISTRRVKVYSLDGDGRWDDEATGQITVDYLEESDGVGLFLLNEGNDETLLLHCICSDDIYRKQDDVIISWRDPDFETGYALSFQETAGCSYIWDHIYSLQRNMLLLQTNGTFQTRNSDVQGLPPVELSNLPLILKTVVENRSADTCATDFVLQDQNFFRKLMELFRISEDLGNVDVLYLIFKIVRGIVVLNSSQIFEKIFRNEFIMDIIGCLEYDPEGPRVHHRDYLKNHLVFKEIIPIKDPVVISKIHQSYIIAYMKDVIFPRALDVDVLANLTSIIQSNNSIVVSLLKRDDAFVKELFASLKSPTISVESNRSLVHFMHGMLGKSLKTVHQIQFLGDLVTEGLFDVLTDILQSEERKLALTGAEIIMHSMALDPNILCTYMERQQDGVLLGVLVTNMLTDFGEDMNCQFYVIVRDLLDPNKSKETIVEVFYKKHLIQLIDALTSSGSPCGESPHDSKSVGPDDGLRMRTKPEILLCIMDLLCFCASQHPCRIKCYCVLDNVINKVLLLTRRKEKYLVVAAVRFLRMLITHSDEDLMKHLVSENLFKPIIDTFVSNGNRDNLLNSAILDLFEYIRKENLSILVRHLVDAFWNKLGQFESCSSIHALKVKYDEQLLGTMSGPQTMTAEKESATSFPLKHESDEPNPKRWRIGGEKSE